MVLSFWLPWASRNRSVCATLKFITVLPFTLLVTQSFPRLPITCNLIILIKFSFVLKNCLTAIYVFRQKFQYGVNYMGIKLFVVNLKGGSPFQGASPCRTRDNDPAKKDSIKE